MALTKQNKQDLVNKYKEKIENANALFVLQPNAINPNEANKLKKLLSAQNSSFNVVKNTLFKVALNESKVEIAIENGENAIVFSGENTVEVVKALNDFIKETEKAEFKTGLVEGKIIDQAQFKQLASLPPREVLLAQVLSAMNGPISGFVRVLGGNMSGLLNVINAIKEQKS